MNSVMHFMHYIIQVYWSVSVLIYILLFPISAEAFIFAGCTTVLILAISARCMLKKKTPADPLFYGNYSAMPVLLR